MSSFARRFLLLLLVVGCTAEDELVDLANESADTVADSADNQESSEGDQTRNAHLAGLRPSVILVVLVNYAPIRSAHQAMSATVSLADKPGRSMLDQGRKRWV